MKIEVVFIAFFASVSTAGAPVLVIVHHIVAETAVPIGTIPQAVGLNGVSNVYLRGIRATARGIELHRAVAGMAAVRTRLTASGDSGCATIGAIPVIHNDSTQGKHLHLSRVKCVNVLRKTAKGRGELKSYPGFRRGTYIIA